MNSCGKERRLGPIEDATNPPASDAPTVGYWHIREPYCRNCVPYDASWLPHIYEPIKVRAQPAKTLICVRCGAVVLKGD